MIRRFLDNRILFSGNISIAVNKLFWQKYIFSWSNSGAREFNFGGYCTVFFLNTYTFLKIVLSGNVIWWSRRTGRGGRRRFFSPDSSNEVGEGSSLQAPAMRSEKVLLSWLHQWGRRRFFSPDSSTEVAECSSFQTPAMRLEKVLLSRLQQWGRRRFFSPELKN